MLPHKKYNHNNLLNFKQEIEYLNKSSPNIPKNLTNQTDRFIALENDIKKILLKYVHDYTIADFDKNNHNIKNEKIDEDIIKSINKNIIKKIL